MANEKLIYASAARRAVLKADPSLAYVIDEVKAVDAVEVVRCKDCKHWTMGYCNNFAYYDYEPTTNEDDFCSYGERRNDGNNDY